MELPHYLPEHPLCSIDILARRSRLHLVRTGVASLAAVGRKQPAGENFMAKCGFHACICFDDRLQHILLQSHWRPQSLWIHWFHLLVQHASPGGFIFGASAICIEAASSRSPWQRCTR